MVSRASALDPLSGWIARVAFVAAAAFAAGCETVQTTKPGAVGIERQQRMLVSEDELRQGAELAYREVLQKEQQRGALNPDPALTNRVRAIVQRIIPTTSAFRPDAPGWKWEANVIRSDQINAWVMPGGKIAIYSALITKLGLSDDELAAVIGHEIAHALREHARERASQQAAAGIALGVGAAILGVGQVGQEMANVAYQVAVGMPNSRTQEVEADRIGVELAARAGYDPRAAITLWQKMNKAGGAGGPEWFSTHPSPENRQRDLEAYAARVMPLYQAAKR